MNDKLTIKIWIIFSILANHFRFKARLSAFAFGVFWRAALCVHQDICCIRGAARGRVLPAKERGQSGRKGHAHHSQTRPHVPPPPLGAQCWRPLHRRERQTCARHTQVIKHGIMHIISLHKTPTHIMFGVNTDMGSSWSFLPSQHSSHSVYKTTCVAFFCLFVFFTHNILLFFLPHTLTSPPLMLGLAPVCPVQCFQRRSSRQCHRWWQQKVIIALQYSSAWWWGFGFLSLSLRCVNTTENYFSSLASPFLHYHWKKEHVPVRRHFPLSLQLLVLKETAAGISFDDWRHSPLSVLIKWCTWSANR